VYQTLDTEGLTALAREGLIEIGAHAVTHTALSSLSPAEQQDEAARSKADLEAALGRPVTSFAYPFGQAGDFTTTTKQAVAAAGFVRACSATGGRPATVIDPYELPRIHVDDLPGPAFEAWLEELIDV